MGYRHREKYKQKVARLIQRNDLGAFLIVKQGHSISAEDNTARILTIIIITILVIITLIIVIIITKDAIKENAVNIKLHTYKYGSKQVSI